jgi:AcrR family transcriptional regulator
MRSDTQRNMRRLLRTVGELARSDPSRLTMQHIAAEAEIAPATAYRYFSTVQDALEAYVEDVVRELQDFSSTSPLEGSALFLATLRHWIELLDRHAPAIIQMRSPRGFLERLEDGNRVIVAIVEAWERPVRQLLAEHGIAADTLTYALSLKNVMLDAREITDLRAHLGLDDEALSVHLTAAFVGALQAWARIHGPRFGA